MVCTQSCAPATIPLRESGSAAEGDHQGRKPDGCCQHLCPCGRCTAEVDRPGQSDDREVIVHGAQVVPAPLCRVLYVTDACLQRSWTLDRPGRGFPRRLRAVDDCFAPIEVLDRNLGEQRRRCSANFKRPAARISNLPTNSGTLRTDIYRYPMQTADKIPRQHSTGSTHDAA